MIANIRALVRLILFFLVSFCTVLLVAIGNIILRFIQPFRAIQWKNKVLTVWALLTANILGLDIRSQGELPKAPFFLVSNHLSYIDVVPLWYYLDGTFIAKSEVKSWPFFGWATQTLGVLFIDRQLQGDVRRMNSCIAETISDHQGVILFPEGTSSKGEKVLPFKSSLLHYPAVKEMPVYSASISYRSSDKNRPAYSHICWWGEAAFLPHFWELLKIKKIEVTIRFGEMSVDNDRKQLAKKLYKAVSQSFDPVVD